MNNTKTINAEAYKEELNARLAQGLITEEEVERLLKEYPNNEPESNE